MKHIKKYKIFEANRWGSESISLFKFKSLLKKNCKNWNENNTKIYRGTSDIGDYVFIDPLKGEIRSSIEDINVHIDSIDYLPSWKDYPKYSKSVIGISGDSQPAYGSTVYEVIPYDNSKIVVCPEPTIWESFGDGGWGEYIYLINNFFHGLDINNVNELKKIGNIMQHVSYPNEPNYIDYFIKKMQSVIGKKEDISGSDCYDFINDYLFNPDERGFELVKYTDNFTIPTYKQIWTDGPVLLKKIRKKY